MERQRNKLRPLKVFLFGETGSGKSTISSLVCHFLMNGEGLTPRTNPRNREGMRYLFGNWIERLEDSKFPIPTPIQKIFTVDVGFEDQDRGLELGLTFFEIAGEEVRKLDVVRRDHEDRLPNLDELVAESSVLLLVGRAQPLHKENWLLYRFLELLLVEDKKPITALVVSKWDTTGRPQADVLDYATKNYLQVLKILSAKFPQSEVFAFSVGSVAKEDDEEVIEEIDYEAGTKALVEWLIEVAWSRS